MADQPNLHIFGLWEETGASGGNPGRHRENVLTPQIVTKAGIEPGSLALCDSSANHGNPLWVGIGDIKSHDGDHMLA